MSRRPQGPPQHERTVWWATAPPPPPTSPLASDARVDVAVIGGGLTGVTAALHLARRGARVALLEAGPIGGGASGLNAGFVVPNFAKADPAAVVARLGREPGERLLRMVSQGADRVFETARELGIACDAEQVGWMQVAHAKPMMDALARRADAWQALGRPVVLLDEAEARARTGMRHCAGALFDASGGMLQPLSYLRGLARAAIEAGAAFHTGTPVDAVRRSGHRWRLAAGGREVDADSVLLCTNAFETGAARRLGRAIVPLNVFQVATTPLNGQTADRVCPRRNPVADTRANLFTYRLDRENRLISGGMAIVPAGAGARMARMISSRLQRELSLPAVPEVAFSWRGVAAMTTDFLPHLVTLGPGFVGGIGCNGRGIALTAMLGEAMADAACGKDVDDLPVPMDRSRAVALRSLAALAPSFAIAQARWQDWRAGL